MDNPTFYVRTTDAQGNYIYVAAKYLLDQNGNGVPDPGWGQTYYGNDNTSSTVNSSNPDYKLYDQNGNALAQQNTNGFLIVPQDYDINQQIALGASFQGSLTNLGYIKYFASGGAGDLQRTYDGQTAPNIVRAFTDAANYNIGIVSAAARITPDTAFTLNGTYNWLNSLRQSYIDTSGYAGDSVRNTIELIGGYQEYLRRNPGSPAYDLSEPGQYTAPQRHSDNSLPYNGNPNIILTNYSGGTSSLTTTNPDTETATLVQYFSGANAAGDLTGTVTLYNDGTSAMLAPLQNSQTSWVAYAPTGSVAFVASQTTNAAGVSTLNVSNDSASSSLVSAISVNSPTYNGDGSFTLGSSQADSNGLVNQLTVNGSFGLTSLSVTNPITGTVDILPLNNGSTTAVQEGRSVATDSPNEQVQTTNSDGSQQDAIFGQGAQAIVTNTAVTLESSAQASVAGNSDSLTLGSDSSATLTGTADTVNAAIASLTLGTGSSAQVFGTYNTLAAQNGSGGEDTFNAITSGQQAVDGFVDNGPSGATAATVNSTSSNATIESYAPGGAQQTTTVTVDANGNTDVSTAGGYLASYVASLEGQPQDTTGWVQVASNDPTIGLSNGQAVTIATTSGQTLDVGGTDPGILIDAAGGNGVSVAANASATVVVSGDQLSAGSGSTLSVAGDSNAISGSSTGTNTLSLTGTDDYVTETDATINLDGSASSATIDGNNNTIGGQVGDSLAVAGSGDGIVIDGTGVSQVTVNSGVNEDITTSGANIYLASGTSATLNGVDNSTNAVDAVVTDDGANDTLYAFNGSYVSVAGAAGTTDLESDGTVVSSVAGEQVNVAGGVDDAAVYGSDDSLWIGSGSTAVILGAEDNVGANIGDTIYIQGANNSVFVDGTGTSYVNITSGTGETIDASGTDAWMNTGTLATFEGGGNQINASAGDTVTDKGNDDHVNAFGDDTLTLGGLGDIVALTGSGDGLVTILSGSTDDAINASGVTISVGADDTASIYGGNDNVTAIAGDTINLAGSGDELDVTGAGLSKINIFSGVNDVIDATGATIWMNTGTGATFNGANNDISGTDALIDDNDADDTIYALDGSYVSVTGTGYIINLEGDATAVSSVAGNTIAAQSGDDNYIFTSNGSVWVNADTVATVLGSNNTVNANIGSTVEIQGSDEAVYVLGAGPSYVNIDVGTGETVNADGAIVYMGTGTTAQIDGSGNEVNAGADVTFTDHATGDTDYVGMDGTAVLDAAGDTVWITDGGSVNATDGAAAIVVEAGTGTIDASNASITIYAGAAATLDGSDNQITAQAGVSITEDGTGDSIVSVDNNITFSSSNAALKVIGSGNTFDFTGTDDTLTVQESVLPQGETSLTEIFSVGIGQDIETEAKANYTDETSRIDYYNPDAENQLEFDIYSAPNETGTLIESGQTNADGSAQQTYFYPTSSIAMETEYFNASKIETGDLINYVNGTSETDDFVPGAGLSSISDFYSGANMDGTLTKAVDVYTDGSSQQTYYNPTSNITMETLYFNASQAETGDLINYKNETSEADNYAPGGGLSYTYDFYSSVNAGGTLTEAVDFYPDGTVQQTFYNPSPNIDKEIQYFNSAQYNTQDIFYLSNGDYDYEYFNGGNYADAMNEYSNQGVPLASFTYYTNDGYEASQILYNSNGQKTESAFFYDRGTYAYAVNTFYDSGQTETEATFNSSTAQLETYETYNSGGQETADLVLTNGSYVNELTGVDYTLDGGTFEPSGGGGGGDDIDYDDGGGYYGGGFDLSRRALNMPVGSDIGVIAQSDLSNGNAQAASIAENAWNDALAALRGPQSPSAISEGPVWNLQQTNGIVTWNLAQAPGATKPGELLAIVEKAFATWGAASGITFVEVTSAAVADISLGWSDLNTSQTDVLGYTSYDAQGGYFTPGVSISLESPAQGQLTAGNPGWLVYAGADATLFQVVLHEIGHALGLADDTDPNSVMAAVSTKANRSLDQTDISGIQTLYSNTGSLPATPASVSAAVSSDGANFNKLVQALAVFGHQGTAGPQIHFADASQSVGAASLTAGSGNFHAHPM